MGQEKSGDDDVVRGAIKFFKHHFNRLQVLIFLKMNKKRRKGSEGTCTEGGQAVEFSRFKKEQC